MIQDPELLNEFVVESLEHLADVEGQLLRIEELGANIDADLVNTVFRAVHSVKGAAGFLGLSTINKLSHSLENVLNQVRQLELVPTSEVVNCMLQSADLLRGLLGEINTSNEVDVSEQVAALDAIFNSASRPPVVRSAPSPKPSAMEAVPGTAGAPANRAVSVSPSSVESKSQEAGTESSEHNHGTESLLEEYDYSRPDQEANAPPAATASTSTHPTTPSKVENTGIAATKSPKPVESSVRVNVSVLDRLMNLAGELVLGRNQLLLAVNNDLREGLENIANRLDQVTTDLQETIMMTRMQPVGNIFNRFPRVVRDLSGKLGKQCNLEIEGHETEIDKTICEAIGDPLTHLVRNSVDHGVEAPNVRTARGKKPYGTIRLRAFHQAGKVCIRIEDDGGGIDPVKLKRKALSQGLISEETATTMSDSEALRLIFAPGFSTAAQVTYVSGRGVGMDVVRTNIESLGGTVDVQSKVGEGTAIHITLPLTLAIIPSMIVGAGKQRFAIPQASIAELVRITPKERNARIGHVHDAEVLRLRGDLLPLVRLSDVLGYSDPSTDRSQGSMNILVLESGQLKYGLVVDRLFDSEEIVVKPLGRHVKPVSYLSGATILGDGHVALILDVMSIAQESQLRAVDNGQAQSHIESNAQNNTDEIHRLLLFSNHPEEHFAIPMAVVSRIERVRCSEIQVLGGQPMLCYRGGTLPLLQLHEHIKARQHREGLERLFVIVFSVHGREIGLVAPELKDIRDINLRVDAETFREPGVAGSTVIEDRTTRLLDVIDLAKLAHPDWFVMDSVELRKQPIDEIRLLLAEDSDFFRRHTEASLAEEGFQVTAASDGQEAWDIICSGDKEFDVVVTDIEMPRMSGLDLTAAIRKDERFRDIPVIAVTSLSSEEDIQRGHSMGVTDYQIKLDRMQLVDSIRRLGAKYKSSQSKRSAQYA